MYKHYIFEVPAMEEVLEDINNRNETIISVMYFSDTQQACIVADGKKEFDIKKILENKFAERY